MSRVSVIIPGYNRADIIHEAIDSVLAQTYRDFEVVIVDDGSTDGTPEVMAAYQAAHPTVVKCLRQDNLGAPAARNTGIRAASGDYLTFLDSDDLYAPRRLEAGVGVLERGSEFGASYVDCNTIDESGRVIIDTQIGNPISALTGWILPLLFTRGVVHTNTITVRRGVLDEVGGFDETLWSGQDTDLWWRIARRFQMVCVPECLATIRQRGVSLSRGTGTNTERLVRLRKWIQGQERYLSAWTDLPPAVYRELAKRIWELYRQKRMVLVELKEQAELDATNARLRELEQNHRLRLYACKRAIGERVPGVRNLLHQAKERLVADGAPSAEIPGRAEADDDA